MPRYAAIDVGSNSIRLLVAAVDSKGRFDTLASDRQVVRLGTGVFRDGRLSDSSMDLACRVLERMTGEYRDFKVEAVRAVGTSALRDASNQVEFVARASAIMRTPLYVISGQEEARLVQRGVQARWPELRKPVLIVDIGGGSAQLILSENGRMVEAFSKSLGAVRLTEVYLKSDPADPREIARLQKHVRDRLAGPLERFGQAGVHRMIATSSTAAAVVCAVNEIKRSRRDDADTLAATGKQVRDLFQTVSTLDLEGRAAVTGVGPRRAEIIVAGVAVLAEIMEGLRLPRLHYSIAGVRDGVVADLAAEAMAGDTTMVAARN
jgi:exopolyphosphatase / guanosine-5'-triphosphate,3'-diphosphate pyrophosphatase